MSVGKGMVGWLLQSGTQAASHLARAVIGSDRARDAAAAAVGVAQRAKERIDAAQERLLHALGLAARNDYAEVARQMARLKRKMRQLERRLEPAGSAGGAAGAASEPSGAPARGEADEASRAGEAAGVPAGGGPGEGGSG